MSVRKQVPDEMRLTYSPEEAAARLGCTGQHIRNRIRAGTVPTLDQEVWGDRIFIPAQWLHQQVEKAMGGM